MERRRQMNVIAINGSPRKGGNIAQVMAIATDTLNDEGLEVEVISIGNKAIRGCLGCRKCLRDDEKICKIKDDPVIETALKMRKADGIILAAPTYYGGIPGTMKAFLDRVFYINSGWLKYKVATAFTTARRSGGVDVIQQLHNYFHLAGTVTPPSQYWPVAYGCDKGESLQDREGLQTVVENIRAMAWLMKTLAAGRSSVPLPESYERVTTNFIRR